MHLQTNFATVFELDEPVTAFGFDIQSHDTGGLTLSAAGISGLSIPRTSSRGQTFFGIVSDTPFSTVTIPSSQFDGFVIDNVTFDIAEPPEPADLPIGTTIGLDFGGSEPTNTPGNDFVETDGSMPIPAGKVHDLNDNILDGVSVSFTPGAQFHNDDGSNANYSALLPGTAVDPFFEESVVTDFAGIFSGINNGVYSVVFSGLDPDAKYSVTAVSAADDSPSVEILTADSQSSIIPRGTSSAPTFHNLTSLAAPDGVLSLDFSQFGGSSPAVNGIVLTVIPEPSSGMLMAVAGMGFGLVRIRVKPRRSLDDMC